MALNEIICDDLFHGIELMERHSVDMVVTSPPYMGFRAYGEDDYEDYSDEDVWRRFCVDVFGALLHAVKPNGVVWWNVGSGYVNHRRSLAMYKLLIDLEFMGWYLIDDIPWIKKSNPPKKYKNRPYPSWEHNFVLSRSPSDVTFYVDHVRRPYAKSTLSRMKYPVNKNLMDKTGEMGGHKKVSPHKKGATPPNHLLLPQDTSRRPHPAPMLPELANWAIRAYSQEGDVILDPMMGCGTVAVEAIKLKRNWVGFDNVQEYVDMTRLSISLLMQDRDPYKELKNEWNK